MMNFDPKIYNYKQTKILKEFEIGKVYIANSIKNKKDKIFYYEVEKANCQKEEFKWFQDYMSSYLKLLYYNPVLSKPGIVNIVHIEDDIEKLRVYYTFFKCHSLKERLQSSPGNIFTEPQATEILFKILRALELLKILGIYHTNIHPNNIFFDDHNNLFLGIPLLGKINSNILIEGKMVSYDSPEFLLGNSPSLANDIWSIGLLFKEMISGIGVELTNNGFVQNNSKVLESKEAKALIEGCLIKDPKKRFTLQDLKNSPLFSKLATPSYKKFFRNHKDGKKQGLPICQFTKKSFRLKTSESKFIIKIRLYFSC